MQDSAEDGAEDKRDQKPGMSSHGDGSSSSGRPNPARIFFAAPIPEEVREAGSAWLAAARARARAEGGRDRCSGVRWTDPRDWHVTLRFVGPVPEDRLLTYVEAGREAARDTPACRARIGELGAFPDSGRARVLWVDVCGEGLHLLAARIEEALARRGVPREPRPFQAHLTLGRLKSAGGGQLREPSPPFVADWNVTQYALYRTLSPGQRREGRDSRYEILEVFEFTQ